MPGKDPFSGIHALLTEEKAAYAKLFPNGVPMLTLNTVWQVASIFIRFSL